MPEAESDGPAAGPAASPGLACLAFALPLVWLTWTLAPGVTFEDSGEYITAAAHLGVAHPSGYPLWCLVAHGFTWLPIGEIAWRVNFVSAFFGAATTCLAYLLCLRVVRSHVPALLSALALAASGLFWSQSVIAEVYTLNTFLTAAALLCVLGWRDDRRPGWLIALAACVGLGASNHHLFVLGTPVLLGWILLTDWRALLRPRVVAMGSLVLLAGLSINLYIPIRANADPPLNWAQPTTFEGTVRHLRRAEVFEGSETVRLQGGVGDWALHSVDALAGVGRAYTWPGLALVLTGGLLLRRQRPDYFWASLALVGLNTLLLNAVLREEFSYAWRYANRVYYLPIHLYLVPWLGCALAVVVSRLGRAGAVAGAAAVAALLVWNLPANDRRDDRLADELGRAFLESLPRGAGLLPIGDEVVFPILYQRHVQGVRDDVSILSPHFGWDGKPVTQIVSGVPVTDAMRQATPELAGFRSVPFGLGYLLARESGAPPPGWGDFVPLAGPAPDPGPMRRGEDLFEIEARRILSTYHTRLGAKRFVEGRRQDARRELDRAEALAQDAHAHFLLARVHTELTGRRDHAASLLERALERFDRYYDPAVMRYYPITRDEITAALERVGR